MTLNDKLAEMGSKIIRIGTKGGSGFIYAGPANECDLYDIDTRLQAYLCTLRNQPQDSIKNRLAEYVPLGGREVIESYPSIRNPETTIVIITGKESEANAGGVELEPMKFKGCCDDLAAGRVIAAIYSQVVDDMETAYDRSACLMPWYDLNAAINAMEQAINGATAPGKGAQLINIKQMRLIMAEIKKWINDGIDDCIALERWMMRETDKDINGHISNPRKVIQQVRDNNRATRIEKHYKSFLDYTQKKDNS